MKRCLMTLAAVGGLAASTACWSKGAITKITIERVGGDTAAIEITQLEVLDRFGIWSGPGVGGWDMAKTVPKPDDAAFIVDWTQGVLAGAPDTPTYEVAMYIEGRVPPCDKYEVLYRVDEAGTGYVYLPRSGEGIGRCNTRFIFRDVEGNWFRASKAWEEVAERFGVGPAAAQSIASPRVECPITTEDRVGNDDLVAWSPGKLTFEPNGPGFVEPDGSVGMKWPFERLKRGRLFVGGRRLDGAAGSARAYIYDYGDSGFQPIYLVFPTPGCWEIQAGVATSESPLTFVVLVEKVGAGPGWLNSTAAAERRVTTHWRDESAIL